MNIKSNSSTSHVNKRDAVNTLNTKIQELDYDIQIAKAECKKKLSHLESEKRKLMKEKRTFTCVKKRNDGYF